VSEDGAGVVDTYKVILGKDLIVRSGSGSSRSGGCFYIHEMRREE